MARRKATLAPDCGQIDEPSVRQSCADVIQPITARQMARIFKALSDPTRLRLISMLASREMCVTDLAAALEVQQSAISHQLSDMREMKLVRFRKEGRHVYYALEDEHVRDLFRQGLAHVSPT